MTDSPYIAILAWIGGVCSFTLSPLHAAEPEKRHVDFRAEEHMQVAPITGNAAFLTDMLVPKISYFEVAGQKQNGKFINASQSDDSFAYRISAGSYYKLNKRIMLYGAIDYTSFTGQNMSGSAFIQSGTTPFDIVEADDANKGRKRLESYVDAKTNTVDEKKSDRFTREMKKKGFTFPARAFWGNPTTRKPYEEGYFCLDAKGQLFQLKMVNGRPFVKNTHVSDSVEVKWFVMNEAMDKRHYGFVFGTKGETGIIEENDGDYRFVQMDIRSFNPAKDELMVLGNILYWTVNVQNEKGLDSYGLNRETLERLSSYHIDAKKGLWDKTSEWLFPCYLSFTAPQSDYVGLYWSVGAWKAFVLNAILALAALAFFYRKGRKRGVLSAVYVLLCGIPALVALLLFR